MTSRKAILGLGFALAALALALAATATGSPDSESVVAGCPKAGLTLKTPGRLTLATTNPARKPWWAGKPSRAPWKGANPYSTQGYESAVAYAIAKRLGFSWRQVDWQPVAEAQALEPGAKTFDFYLGQVTYGSIRDRAVDFSSPYYFVPQALLSRRGLPSAGARKIAEVRIQWLGVLAGTTGHAYTGRYIRPVSGPLAYDSEDGVLYALERGRPITGIVLDLPTAYKLRTRVTGGVVVGQFPRRKSNEHFALVFEQGSPLRGCVNKALAQLKKRGTLAALQKRWLALRTIN
jgi:polar amino acid transport system substrate-binding protein